MCESGGTVNNIDKLREFIDNSSTGIISSKEILENNFSRATMNELIRSGELTKYGRGFYIINNIFEDDFYIINQRYSKGVFSHTSALFLLGYTLNTPIIYEMTFPKGYNTISLKNENVRIVRVIIENFDLGIEEATSPNGNKVRCYNIERTLCDILRGKGSEISIINYAFIKYINSKDKNIQLLLKYAEQLNVRDKVLKYLEVLL